MNKVKWISLSSKLFEIKYVLMIISRRQRFMDVSEELKVSSEEPGWGSVSFLVSCRSSCSCPAIWAWSSSACRGVLCTGQTAPSAACPETPTVPGTDTPAPDTSPPAEGTEIQWERRNTRPKTNRSSGQKTSSLKKTKSLLKCVSINISFYFFMVVVFFGK